MNVVLVNPRLVTWSPSVYLPLGLAYVASALENAGHSVSIVDMNSKRISDNELAEDLKGVDVIGIGGMITEYKEVVRLSKVCKQANPRAKIMFGGGLATTHTKEVLADSQADFAVIGEGERTVASLVSAIENGGDFSVIKGIAYKTDGRVNINAPVEQIENLDTIAYPARHLFDLSRYTAHHFRDFGIKNVKVKSGTMLTSRGCPYQCTFCFSGIWGHKWRGRSPENIVGEIKHLHNKYGFNAVVFNDDTFVMKKQRVMDFCKQLLDMNLGTKWYCNGRINLMDEEMLEAMHDAGCVGIGYGLESGNQGMLDSLKKAMKLEDVVRVVGLTHKAGINITGYFILGLLDETKANIRETIEFARKLDLDFYAFALYAPITGTPLYNAAQEKGLLKNVKLQDWNLHAGANITLDCTNEELDQFGKQVFKEFTIQKRYGKHYKLNPRMWRDGIRFLSFLIGKRDIKMMLTRAWGVVKNK